MRKKAVTSAISMSLSQKKLDIYHMFLVLCTSLRPANDHIVRLWLGCEFSTLYNAKILFHTRARIFCICVSHVVNNIESKVQLCTTCGRCEMEPYTYILLTSQKFCTKIYVPNLSLIMEGVLKFHPQALTRSQIITVQSFQNPLPNFRYMVGKGF